MEPMNTELPQNPLTPVGAVATSSPVVMDPSLLMALSSGDYEELENLLNWGDSPVHPAEVAQEVVRDVGNVDASDVNDVTNGNLAAQPTSADGVEEGPGQPNGASNGSLASEEVTEQPAGNATDGGTDQLGSNTNGSSAMRQGVDQPPVTSSESLLNGVTKQGDTALHVAAKSGCAGENFINSVYEIYKKAKHLLDVQNKMGNTPLHCAAQTGNYRMMISLVRFAKREEGGDQKSKALLRKQNKRGETVLHEAIYSGDEHIVDILLRVDSKLARFPSEGTSPLYLAILLGKYSIALKLHAKDHQLSYSGPDGQNALHAAVMWDRVVTKKLLEWKWKDLTEQADKNGSTPLHFAASHLRIGGVHRVIFQWRFPWIFYVFNSRIHLDQLLEANPAQLYQSDNNGLYPIHVAASTGASFMAIQFIKKYPGIADLRDAKGKTFLHVAVEMKKWNIVKYACQTSKLAWILNMQDNEGNTALHLAVHHGVLPIFCSLLENRGVWLNIPNNNGETPLDLSRRKIPAGFFYGWNHDRLMFRALTICHARHGNRRFDHFQEQYISKMKPGDEGTESDKLTSSTQVLGIGSALIATVTFGATFALPGGYKADDHYNGGTPTLAGRYVFDAFVMANTIAFICSAMATMNLMYSG